MAKKREKQQVKGSFKTKSKTRVAVYDKRTLDKAGMDYLRLLTDPCGAPLTHPIYPGGDAGYLFRADTIATFGGGATETSGIVHWTPGYPNSSNTTLLVGASANDNTTVTLANNGNWPGQTFLNTNARGARCVAACVRVTYPGSESGRSGRIHFGQCPAGSYDDTATIKPKDAAVLLQHYSRTPTETVEVIWRPAVGDFDMVDPSEVASAQQRDRKSAVNVVWAGLPTTTGMVFHFIAVYEWVPVPGLGATTNVIGKARSKNSFDDVLDYAIERGEKFVRYAGMAGIDYLGNALANAVSRQFGTMPAALKSMSRLRLGN